MIHENTLWRRIQQNDNQSLKELFDLHYKPLCSYAVQFTHCMIDAEDIVQSVFIALWDKREKLEIETSLKAYLYKSVYNAAMNKFRKDKQKDAFLEKLKYEALRSQIIEDNTLLTKKIIKIKSIVAALPDRCNEIIMLSKVEGLKNREIAERLSISIKTVESQIRIAYKKIRKEFKDNDMLLFLLFRPLVEKNK